MKRVLLAVSIVIAILISGFSMQKVYLAAEANSNIKAQLINSYDWSSFSLPSTYSHGTQTSDKIYWDTTDLAALYMYPSSYSAIDNMKSDSIINWKQVNIFCDVIYDSQDSDFYFHKSFDLKKEGNLIYSKSWSMSERSSLLLFSGQLPEGDYSFTYTGVYTQTSKKVITFTYDFSFKINQTPPIYILKSGENVITTLNSFVNETITYSARSDILNGIYVKRPEAPNYDFYNESIVIITDSSVNGEYCFYADTVAGEVTPTVSVWLDTIPPNGIIYVDGESMGNESSTIKSFNYIATDNGSGIDYVQYKTPKSINWEMYISGTVIPNTSPSGRYDFKAVDKSGNVSNISTVYLSVPEHSFYTETIFPTCTEGGCTRYICSDCEYYYDVDILPPKGHEFISTIINPTCTKRGETLQVCTTCKYEQIIDILYPSGHSYDSYILKSATCVLEGKRRYVCEFCGDQYDVVINVLGHNYIISDIIQENEITKRVFTCSLCGDSYTQDLGNQYEKVTSYVEYLFNVYSPYMIWVFLATAGVWSIVLGVMIIIAHKNEDKEKAKKMLINYGIGLIVIFCILIACPYLIKGIASLIA